MKRDIARNNIVADNGVIADRIWVGKIRSSVDNRGVVGNRVIPSNGSAFSRVVLISWKS